MDANLAEVKHRLADRGMGADTINKILRLARLISAFIFFVLYLDDIGGIT